MLIYALSAEVLGTEVGLLTKNLYSWIAKIRRVLYDSGKATQLSLVVNESIFQIYIIFLWIGEVF